MNAAVPPLPMPKGAEELGAWYDEDAAQRAVDFFPTYLCHVEGEWAGQPFYLNPWQERPVRAWAGYKLPDGRRLIRVIIMFLPRKNGKTSFGSGFSLLLLVGDAEPGGQGYVMAVDKDQADILFRKSCQMANGSPRLKEHMTVLKTAIWCDPLQASFKPLSRTVANKHGFSPSFAVGDELHEWPDGDVADVVHKGMAARRQPLELFISTAGLKNHGYGWEMYDYARRVHDGEIIDPHCLPVIFEAGDDEDWTDENVWAKANPNLGVSVKLDFLRGECEKAKRSPRLENDFRRFHLNQWTEQVTRWLPMASWVKCSADPRNANLWKEVEARYAGRRCFGGLDLGGTRDISALVYAFPPIAENERLALLCRFWVPQATLDDRVDRRRVPYRQWADQGAIVSTEGNATDFRAIQHQIWQDCETFEVAKLGIDPFNAMQLMTDLHGEGVPVEAMRQGFLTLGSPTRELERLVIEEDELEHGNHPVLTFMASNAVVVQDPAGNIKPAKDRATEKIDGVVATINALGLLGAAQVEQPIVYRRGEMFGEAAE